MGRDGASSRRRHRSRESSLSDDGHRRRARHRRRRSRSHDRHRRRRSPRSPRSRSRSASPVEDAKPNLGLSGKLAAESNKLNGVVLKYTEPVEAKLPETRWRLYVFKDGQVLGDPIPLHRQTFFLFGRDRTVCDIPTDHPSCSKQHCVVQHRCVAVEDPKDGSMCEIVKPYLIDLGSINGTFINKQRMDPQRYYELLEQVHHGHLEFS